MHGSARTRPPAVAGSFYPSHPAELAALVDGYLQPPAAAVEGHPKALIVPHAGYIYSGATAGNGYALLKPWRETISRVVLLGPTHRVAVRGLALPESTRFETPLGPVPIDRAGVLALSRLPQVVLSDAVHAQEHSLEVHLPFLQRALQAFTLLPLAVGHATPEQVAEVLEAAWGGDETLIVVSSDLSHFLPYDLAQQIDRETCDHILHREPSIHPEQACGAYPVNGLLVAARRHGLFPSLVHLCNSGDTAGDKTRVVGYATFVFAPGAPHHG